MKNIFLIVAIALVYSSAMAHNPLTAKFELNTNLQKGAILNVYTSQTGVHQALIKYYTQIDFTAITENEYKVLVVEYIKKHLSIKADDTPLIIGEGGIKLGNHQTDLKFLIENYPNKVSSLQVILNAFEENENHHSVFWWKTKEGKSKVILSAKNGFQGTINYGQDDNSVLVSKHEINNLHIILLISSFILLLGVYRRVKLKTVANNV